MIRLYYDLCIGTRTVDSHRQRIMAKLGMNSLDELTRFAVREGLISLDG
jgi:DNA-binding NarL/FixJ family response regulator